MTVLFSEVEIDLYILTTEGNFFKNVFTLLNVSLLSEETVNEQKIVKVQLCF